jgi:tRNA threonylcarbamoyladenosine biosynthesis protein TsaE
MTSFESHSESQTRRFAAQLAATLSPGTTILLHGDLGAGKTAFVKGLAEGLGLDPASVTSPTFTLVHEYRGGRLPLIHIDLYRLNRVDLNELGFDTDAAASGVVAIEWPERLAYALPDSVVVRITDHGDSRRSIEVRSQSRAHA